MEEYQSYNNPFVDPFDDAAVREATQNKDTPIGYDYDPFSIQQTNAHNNLTGNATNGALARQPQTQTGPSSPPFRGGYGSGPTAAELQKRQEELDKRADDLRMREEAVHRNLSATESRHNFPPLPKFCPIRPCFYQDIESEIPVQFQGLVSLIFYFWAGYNVLLMWNTVMCLTYFVVTVECGLRNHSAVNFTLSLLNLIIFSPASYVFWFRPVYRAFKYDSSINFFVFFFVFFMQFVTTVMQCLAIDGWGFVGILNSMDMFTSGTSAASIVGVFMFLTGIAFGVAAAFIMILLVKVHQVYRSSGGSLAKAHMELTNDIKSSQVMQEAAGNIAESAASQALLGRN